MGRISTTAEQEIAKLLTSWWTAVNAQLAEATGSAVQIGQPPVALLIASEIGQRLFRIAETAEFAAAAGARQHDFRWSEELAAQVLADCDAVEAWLNQGPFTHKTPEAFWASPVGYMILRARVWANRDQLITLSAAAEISGMSLSVLSQRMTRGQIPGYRDPAVKNPKHGRRVRLSDLHSLIQDHAARAPYTAPQAQPSPAPTPSRPAHPGFPIPQIFE